MLFRSGNWRRLLILLAVGLGVGVLVYTQNRPKTPRDATAFLGRVMGTSYSITVVAPPPGIDPEALHREAKKALDRVDAMMSTYQPQSEVSRFNASSQTDWLAVSPQTARVVQQAIEVGRRSGGGYDITVGPLVNLWGFGPATRPVKAPAASEIEQARSRVGLEQLEVRLDPPALRKKIPGLYLDLSSIAKGFGVDQAAEALERRGIRDYCVEVGGEIRARGCNARGVPWQIGIEAPLAEERSIERVIPLQDMAVATSGDYRNYIEEDGIRLSHIIDPHTGHPIRHKLASVTVFDPTCARADAWATALLVAGPEEGYSLAVRERIPALLIIKTDQGFMEKWTPAAAEGAWKR